MPDWNDRYRDGNIPWDTGRHSAELARVLYADQIHPCRVIEFGCGTGSNAVWLAEQGYDVTGLDLSPLAIERANQRAAEAGVKVRFLAGDLLAAPDLGEPADFLFDRGCYHAVRRENVAGYLDAADRALGAGGIGLVLAGNAKEKHDPGPPVVEESEFRGEIGSRFDIVWVREFRFDPVIGVDIEPLGWSCFFRKRRA